MRHLIRVWQLLQIGILAFLQPCQANSPYIVKVQHYSLGEGLPNRGVLTIGQDKQGFIWIGTLDNAYRFDGFTFKTLPGQLTSTQLPPVIKNIHCDADGNLWFFKVWSHFQRQIDILAPGQQKPVAFEDFFHRKLPFDVQDYTNSAGFIDAPIRPTDPLLIPHSDGSVWLHKGRGLFKRLYQHPAGGIPQKILITPTNTVLFSYLVSGKPKESELIEVSLAGEIRRRQHLPVEIYPVWVDSTNTIYLSRFTRGILIERSELTAQRVQPLLLKLHPDGTMTNLPITLPKGAFTDLLRFNNGKTVYDSRRGLFWFIGKSSLIAWHPRQGVVFDLTASGFPVASLIDLNHLFIDRTGAIWVGTHNGFLLLTLEPNRFQRYSDIPSKPAPLPLLSTQGLVRIGDWLWVNAQGGLLLNLKTGSYRHLRRQSYGPAIRGFDNRIWTASNNSLLQIEPTTATVHTHPITNFSTFNPCWAIWQDKQHNFWLGYDQGLSYFDVKTNRNEPFRRYNQFQELANNRINGFFPDSAIGGLWVATSSGLYQLDTVRGITARYSSQNSHPNQLPFDYIKFLHIDRHQPGIYWLATRGGGLIQWERKTGRWQQFNRDQGLSNNDIYSIHEDRNGHLWLPSNYGLMRFNKRTHQVQLFLPKDGIAHEEFNMTAHFQSADGQLFLGGLNGVTSFYPDQQAGEKPVIVPLLLTQYEQLNAQTGKRINYFPAFEREQKIVLPPENRSFSLSFALLDYRYGRQFRLSYRIVNWQDYWTSQLQRDIAISGLPPGEYQLQVRAQNPSGQWVSETLSIPITVLKPFYLQTWFLTLIILSLIGATIGFFQWRNHRLSQETKRLEEEVARRTAQIANDKAVIEQQAADLQASATLKSRFFANVSHEFRTPLTLLLGPLSYLSKHLSDPVMVRLVASMDRNARQLLTMVSDLLDLSKLDENGIQLLKQPTDLAQLINQTVAMFHSQADYTGITLTAEGTTEPRWLLLDPAKVETVLKNLLANALRFTPSGGTITVRMHPPDSSIRIEVVDTGSGIHPDDLPHIFERYYQSKQPDAPLRGGTGIGLALVHDYCALWGGRLAVVSEPGQGSTFAFTHPYQPVEAVEPQPLPSSEPLVPAVSEEKLPAANPVAPRVLLVEDNTDMVTYLETILAPLYRLHITRNGREAWEWLPSQPEQNWPQLIVTDLMMPDMDGLALVDRIRRQPNLRTIPVLMLTARTSLDVKLEALRLGVADYVTKPFDQDELVTRINNLLERSQERLAWQQTADEVNPPPSQDDEWLVQIEQLVLKNLTNNTFQVGSLAEALNSSERQLYRRLKKATGFSPNQFMQEIRLQTAREWLENQRFATVKEACYAVGFQDAVYFSRLFLHRFGRYPVSYLRTAEMASETEE
ncbi:ATP-binding protein [Larkinella sp. VNQ87]|uniref:ATP-binding protein n=1 Tax=Larkinella sp. VNQ87 TaxID=3400921 RepID=UPI003C0635B7